MRRSRSTAIALGSRPMSTASSATRQKAYKAAAGCRTRRGNRYDAAAKLRDPLRSSPRQLAKSAGVARKERAGSVRERGAFPPEDSGRSRSVSISIDDGGCIGDYLGEDPGGRQDARAATLKRRTRCMPANGLRCHAAPDSPSDVDALATHGGMMGAVRRRFRADGLNTTESGQ